MSQFKAPALAKGLDIIDLIRQNGPMSFNEIQHITQDNPASLSRYLQTLMAKDYLYKNNTQKYALGVKMINVSDTKSLWPRLKNLCLPIMKRIHSEFGTSVLLLAYTGDTYNAIEKVIAENNLGMMAKGSVRANGLEHIWSSLYYNPSLDMIHEIKMRDLEQLHHDPVLLAEYVTKQGHMMYSDPGHNILRVGFPVRYNGHVIASIGVGSFIPMFDEAKVPLLVEMTTKYIQTIEADL